jgi:hypothetical protein
MMQMSDMDVATMDDLPVASLPFPDTRPASARTPRAWSRIFTGQPVRNRRDCPGAHTGESCFMSAVRVQSGGSTASRWTLAMLLGILLAFGGATASRAQCPDIQLPSPAQQAASPIRFIATDGAPASYYRTALTNVPAGYSITNGSYRSWCIDYWVPLHPDSWLNGTLYNSVLDSLPPHLQSTNWDMVNYILNHKLGTAFDVQAAIWHFIGGPVPPSDPVFYPPSVSALAMISNALAHGEGYLPSGPGAVVAVIVDPGPDIQALIIEVAAPLHRPPVALPDSLVTERNQPLLASQGKLLSNDYDPDGDLITFVGVSSNSVQGGVITISGTNILYTPPASFVGTDSFTYSITDNICGTNNGTVTVTVSPPTNQPPVVMNDTAQTLRDQPVNIPVVLVLANDTDPDGDPLVIIGVSTNSTQGGVVQIVGTNIVYTPPPGYVGSDSFTYTVSDGRGGTATATVTINVIRPNQPPVVVNDMVDTLRDQPVIIPVIVVLTNDMDPDGGVLVVIGVSTNSANGGVVFFDGTNIVYIPPPGFVGPDTFSYTVSDGQGGTATGTVTVNVIRPNAAPVLANDNAQTLRDQPVNIPFAQVLANDSDPDGDALVIIGVSTNSAQGGVVQIFGMNIVYTPPPGYVGPDTFTYAVSDGHGGTATATVTVNVIRPNSPPIAVNDNAQTLRDQPLLIPGAQVLANDTDVDGDTLTITSVQTFTTQGGAAQFDGTSILYVPPLGFDGTDTFTYSISDAHGGAATGTVTVNVIRPNQPPVVVNDNVDTLRDQPVNIPVIVVLTNDMDPDGGVLVVIGVSTNSAHGGVVFFDGTNIVYTPPPGFFGPDTFTYTVSDGQGGTATGTVTVNVIRPNTPPVAVNDAVATDANTALSIPALTLLANDTDSDGDTLIIQSVATMSVRGGAVQFDGTNILYTPPAGFFGTDGFTYTISDGHGGTATATVTVTVRPPNRPPLAGNLTLTTPMNTPLTVPLATIVALATDPDGDTVLFREILSNLVANCRVVLDFPNVLFFPPVDYVGQSSFPYVVHDGHGLTATGTVMVTVVAAALPIVEEAAVFNPQTGLFEQRVTVSNESSNTIAAFQLCISNLRSNIQCRSAFMVANGTNFVQVNRAINPNTSVVVRVEYYVPDRRPFTPVITLKTVMPVPAPATNGTGVAIDRSFLDTRIAGEPRYVIEFTSTPAKVYTIIYSDDMVAWKAATPTVTATANRTQWYDDGAPKTDSKPGVKGTRFYKVIQAP